ncbi:hypothetical protein HU200_034609 [Digitaria exilis]|uniref:Uncharacterized protein n=1 Tax=Digitaria exilis TaxID=1010633 RepID=A0A835EJV7_9POAL|nr:hypothetical protein HU200_034609 [Digitaria exilis]
MADLVLGLAKTTVEGTVTMARSAMEEEEKLQKSVQRDLLVISDEFDMMHSFLNDAKDRVTDNVTKTLVRQVRNTALDVEDCIEIIVHLDKKPHWLRRMMLPWCMPTVATWKDLDAAVANVEQLKARVEAMGLRNLRYNRIGDSSHKPVEKMHQQAVANTTAPNIFFTENSAQKKQDNDKNEKEEKHNVQEKANDVQLQVISVLGTGSNPEMVSIDKAYHDSETCKSFKYRAWVKLVHPFNPIEFIRSVLAQFYKNLKKQQEETLDFLEVLMATDNELIVDFKCQIKLKYLVILEDVSTMADWEAVRGYLPDNKNGSCIVVHTRRFDVARSCVGNGYQVSELEKNPSIYLLYKEVWTKLDAARNENDVDKEDEYKQWLNKNPLFGHDEDLRWLSWLMRPSRVVSVWGISGVGKSFLIQHFCRKAQQDYQDQHCKFVWLNVPHPFDLRVLSRSLLSELKLLAPQDHIIISNIKDPVQGCREYLQNQGQKQICYFIVIDGLQSTEEWDLIRPTFVCTDQKKNIAIIIITNEEDVAIHCATEKRFVWNVKGLEVDNAIKLFNQHQNEQTRGLLLQKCGGLPKVICAVAESWANAPHSTRSLGVMFTWLDSYFRNCPDSLKPCIFYLSIFPLNHPIRRRRLVRRWIAEGYFRNNKESTAEENADRSFSKLVNLSMIQAPSTEVNYEGAPLCQVNGFLREYIVSRLMEENLVFALEGHCSKDIQRTGRHLAIDKSWDRDRNVFESIDLSLLRSLTVFGKWESFIISNKMKMLRVLDLDDVTSGVTNGDVEKMVKQLPRLKFLSLRKCKQITRLPDSLGDLKQLQTLDIRETSVIKLPNSIIKLEKLQYIYAGTAKHDQSTEGAENPSAVAVAPLRRSCAALGSCLSKSRIHRPCGSYSGVKVPRGIRKLSGLHTLGVVSIHSAGEDGILEDLKTLTQLHKLEVSDINRKNSEKFFSYISRLVHLESLSLQMQGNPDSEDAACMADISSPLENLRSLRLCGLLDRLPSWITQMCLQLPRLKKLDLQMKTLPQQQLDFVLTLPHLRTLRLQLAEFQDGELRFCWCVGRNSGEWVINFLDIACNSRLQAVRFGSKLDVEIMKIRCCSVSSSLKFSGLQSMESLKEVWLSGSYEQGFMQQLDSDLKKNKNKPILKLEKSSPST